MIKKIDTLMCCDALAKLERMIENMTSDSVPMISNYMELTTKSMIGKGFNPLIIARMITLFTSKKAALDYSLAIAYCDSLKLRKEE